MGAREYGSISLGMHRGTQGARAIKLAFQQVSFPSRPRLGSLARLGFDAFIHFRLPLRFRRAFCRLFGATGETRQPLTWVEGLARQTKDSYIRIWVSEPWRTIYGLTNRLLISIIVN